MFRSASSILLLPIESKLTGENSLNVKCEFR